MLQSFASSRSILSCLVAMSWPTGLRQASAQSSASFHIIQAGPGTWGEAVSADGSTVVGGVNLGGGEGQAYRWTAAGGVQLLGDLSGGTVASHARGVSADGSVVVGHAMPDAPHFRAARWSGGGWSNLGILGCDPGGNTPFSWAWDVSADGSVAVGQSFPCGAFRSVGGSIVEIGGSAVWALGVSADGSVIVGYRQPDMQPAEAFRWTTAGGVSGLGWLAGGPPTPQSIAYNVSADGSVVVGRSTGPGGQLAFRWTQATDMTSLGDLSGGVVFSEALGVSADGSRIVGRSHVADAGLLSARAFIWEQGTGMRDLNSVLVNDYGVALNGWTLIAANDISDDGRVIAGNAHNGTQQVGWVVILPSPDADGDSLLDDWETNGIPYTDSTGIEQRYVLDFDGDSTPDCDVNRKDIFVEVDAMNGFAPNPAAYIAVKAAFNTAPVTNPNGAAPGIKLHVIEDELNIPVGDWTQDDTNGNLTPDWPTEFDALKLSAASGTTLAGYFGTQIDRNDPDGAGIREARAKAFRYCIFGRAMDPTPTTTGPGGIGEIGGNDFAVTMGLWAGVTAQQHAGMFMHELGHTLGLRHGGGDDINYKPNYHSVMNYALTTPQQWFSPNTWPVAPGGGGFSRFALLTLNENALNECAPQVVPGSALAGASFISSYVSGGTVHGGGGRFDVATDWNNSGGGCKDPIADDINRLPIEPGQPTPPASPGELLVGHDDWAAIDLNFRDSPCFAAGVHNSGLGEAGAIDITFEESQAINNMLPPFCPGDIINDRSVDIDDLLAVINAWGACPQGCLADIAPLPADGLVNIDDLLAVINAWGPCP